VPAFPVAAFRNPAPQDLQRGTGMSATLVGLNDDQLLRTLHDEHAHALWAYVVGLTGGDRTRAEDVVQETLLRAWRTPSVLDQSRGSARGWLYTVARRIVIDEWRSARRRHEVVTDEVPEQFAGDLDMVAQRTVDRELVVTALRTLSDEHRDVILECYFRGSTVAEAAGTLGIPPGTVKSRTHYALRALKLAIEELGGGQ
jgi:RNA polymerase sigma-70 factor, ECF subfamily